MLPQLLLMHPFSFHKMDLHLEVLSQELVLEHSKWQVLDIMKSLGK